MHHNTCYSIHILMHIRDHGNHTIFISSFCHVVGYMIKTMALYFYSDHNSSSNCGVHNYGSSSQSDQNVHVWQTIIPYAHGGLEWSARTLCWGFLCPRQNHAVNIAILKTIRCSGTDDLNTVHN